MFALLLRRVRERGRRPLSLLSSLVKRRTRERGPLSFSLFPFPPSFLSLFSFGKRGERNKTSLSSFRLPWRGRGREDLLLLLFTIESGLPEEGGGGESRRRGDHPGRETTATLSSRQMQNYVCLHANSKLASQISILILAVNKFANIFMISYFLFFYRQ